MELRHECQVRPPQVAKVNLMKEEQPQEKDIRHNTDVVERKQSLVLRFKQMGTCS